MSERGNLFDPHCPTRMLVDRIGDKWSVLAVTALRPGPLRFGELRSQVGSPAPKVLTTALRSLETDGLITRTVYAQVPPRVDYALTPMGESLATPLAALVDWAETHLSAVEDARTRAAGG